METVASPGLESDDTVRILKDIRDEIRNVRNELRDEIRGVRTERVDRPDGRGKVRAALIALGFGVAVLAGALLFRREVGSDGAKNGAQKVGGEIAAIGAPAPSNDPPIPAPPLPAIAASTPVTAAPGPVVSAPPAAAAPKRAGARHKARPPTEAELEEPAKL